MGSEGYPVCCRTVLPVLMLIMALLVSCARIPPQLVGDPVSRGVSEGLMQGWYDISARIVSVQGLAKVKVHSPDESLNGTQVILAEKPDRLRAETLSPFGTPLLLLSVDGEDLGVSLPSRNLYYTGTATPENLGRFVNIPLSLPALVSVLLYQPPVILASSEEAFELAEGGWLLVRYGVPGRQELTFSHDRQLVGVSYFDQDEPVLKIDYGQFTEQGGGFPQYFGIELSGQKITASLEFSDLEINGKLPPGIFQLLPPPGSTIIPLDHE